MIRILIQDINKDKLPEILVQEKKIELKKAKEINQELFDHVYGDIYNELEKEFVPLNTEVTISSKVEISENTTAHVEMLCALRDILRELKIMNMHNEIITDNVIDDKDL